jgi:hypothetical protein
MSTNVPARSWRDWSSGTKLFVAGGIAAAIAVVAFLYV